MNETIESTEVGITNMQTNSLLPLYLNPGALQLLVIGGGKDVLAILDTIGTATPLAKIMIIAPVLSREVKERVTTSINIVASERAYTISDMDDVNLVIAVLGDDGMEQQVRRDVQQTGKLLYIAGKPELSDFSVADSFVQPVIPVEDEIYINETTEGLEKILTEPEERKKDRSYKHIATRVLQVFAIMLIGHFIFSYIPYDAIKAGSIKIYEAFDKSFLVMLLAGFIAQLVDGALGMGYGVTSATILLSAGVNPAAISGSIHTAEMFASGASGYSHYKFGNVNKKLFKTLLIPGIVGAIAGAVLLFLLGEKYGDWVKPVLAVYTLFLGIKILFNAFQTQLKKKKFKNYRALAGAGGFFDSFGGGGWGPIVTTTLITKGRSPKYVIGSVSLTEFFVTFSSALTFFILLGVSHWQTIIGLIIGGLIAAPIAAKLAGRLPRRTAFILLGILVIIWSVRIIVKAF